MRGAVYATGEAAFGGLGHQQVAPTGEYPARHAYSLAHGTTAETQNLFECLARHPGSVQNEYRTRGPASLLQIVDSLRSRVHPSGPRRSHQSCSFASGQRAVLGISMGWSSAATSATLQSLRRRLLGWPRLLGRSPSPAIFAAERTGKGTGERTGEGADPRLLARTVSHAAQGCHSQNRGHGRCERGLARLWA